MNRRYSSRLTWPCFFRCAFILMLGCIGCNKPPMFHITASSGVPDDNEQFKIFLKGKELGTVTGNGKFEFDAQGRKGDTLEEAKPEDIEAKSPWLCGWVKADANLYLARPDELELARKESRPVQAVLSLNFDHPNAQLAHILVDNRGGPPATISIGELQEKVAAGETNRIDMYYSADCEEAKEVRLNGQIVAPADAEKTLLIDVMHSHCYLDEWATYETWPGDSFGPNGGRKLYRPAAFHLLDSNPDYFMEPLPSQVTSSTGYDSREALNSVPCSAHAH